MKKILFFASLLFFLPLNLAFANAFPPTPTINEIDILTPIVEKLDKFEVRIDLTAEFDNPYDYDQISVGSYITSPSGLVDTIDGFYMQDYTLNETTGNLSLSGNGEFRIRYAPKEIGIYSFKIIVTDAAGTAESDNLNFTTTEISNERNHGFLRPTTTNYLKFDDESQYIAIGENIAWQNNNPYLNYKNWLTNLAENGGNFFRLWHAHWGLGVEWNNGNGFQGLRHYKQSNCFYQDWLYDFCAENGIYVMLALQHHGPVSTNVNPNWQDSPYNVANGGPCQNTLDFFINDQAKEHTKNRYRYIVARWAYSRNILCWELFNEVHWTDNFEANMDLVADWHIEMADYLKSLDPNQHIITTSYGGDLTDEEVWNNANFHLTQSHLYNNAANIEKILANANYNYLDAFEKPTLNGEFGLGINAGLSNEDPDGIHLHNALWGGLFSGGLGTAMSWWWDSYIHPQDLYFHFIGIEQFVNQVDFLDKRLSPANAYVSNAPGNLVLEPVLDWGIIATDSITINTDGSLEPANPQLSQFLYGSAWNTQYRSPPVFTVNYPEEGSFVVKTGTQTGSSPQLEIWIDGNLVLQESANIDTEYSVVIPAGEHTIRVDNSGTDWILIDGYTFANLGSLVDAYVLKSDDQRYMAGWVIQNKYNHKFIEEFGLPDETPLTSVWVDGFEDGVYAVHLFDPIDGTIISSGEPAVAENGTLRIPLPPFVWDLAFIIDDSPVTIKEIEHDFHLHLFPNPVKTGQFINVQLETDQSFEFYLIDNTGRTIYQKKGNRTTQFPVPATLPSGFYWVKIEQNGKSGVKPIVISNK